MVHPQVSALFTVLFCLLLVKEKLNILLLVQSYINFYFLEKLLKQGTEKPYLLLLWTMVGGGVGYQDWQEFCSVWLELVCQEGLGQAGICTSFDREL